jgi:hypothetical protein
MNGFYQKADLSRDCAVGFNVGLDDLGAGAGIGRVPPVDFIFKGINLF